MTAETQYCTVPPTYANSTGVYMKPPISATSQSLWNCTNSNAVKIHIVKKAGLSTNQSPTFPKVVLNIQGRYNKTVH